MLINNSVQTEQLHCSIAFFRCYHAEVRCELEVESMLRWESAGKKVHKIIGKHWRVSSQSRASELRRKRCLLSSKVIRKKTVCILLSMRNRSGQKPNKSTIGQKGLNCSREPACFAGAFFSLQECRGTQNMMEKMVITFSERVNRSDEWNN